MQTKTEKMLDWLIKQRKYVLSFLLLVLVGSLLLGYLYQNKLTKESEASVLLDDTWQSLYAVISDMQSQPNQAYTPQSATFTQVTNLYQQILIDLETLTIDYKDTTAGVRAALLVQMVLPLSNLNSFITDKTVLTSLSSEGYLDEIKEKNPNFWGAVVILNEAMAKEQKLDFAGALDSYQEALMADKEKILGDYITVAIARNNEILGNTNQAIEYYQELEDDYPNSVWLSFAIGKKYLLSQQSSETVDAQSTEKTNK